VMVVVEGGRLLSLGANNTFLSVHTATASLGAVLLSAYRALVLSSTLWRCCMKHGREL
jgi:hypothetical protein